MSSDTLRKPDIRFHCTRGSGGCGARFSTSDYQTTEYPEQDFHPYQHTASCPRCGEDVHPAAHQLAAWKSASLPMSLESRAKISAAQKARDPASYAISKSNRMITGANAKVLKAWPAKPGVYAECEMCEFLNNGCKVDFQHCADKTDLYVKFLMAQETGNSAFIGQEMAATQAGMAAITASMIRSLAQKGVTLEVPVYTKTENGIEVVTYTDEDGKTRTITRIEANPLLPHLINYVSKNNLTLGDMGLTPKVKEEQRQLQGYLDSKEADRETQLDAINAQQRMVQNLLRVVGGARVIEGGRVIDSATDDASDAG